VFYSALIKTEQTFAQPWHQAVKTDQRLSAAFPSPSADQAFFRQALPVAAECRSFYF